MLVYELVVWMLISAQQRAPGSKWDRRQRDVIVCASARVGAL